MLGIGLFKHNHNMKNINIRLFTEFQHWLGTNYTNLPTDSDNMTKRAILFLQDIEKRNIINNVSYNCVCCDKPIKKLDGLPNGKDWEGMFDGGIVEKISAGYGSDLDGDIYILAICDNCIKEKKLKYIGNYLFPEINDEK